MENQLKDWKPRGPSPELKKRIFTAPAATVPEAGVTFSLSDFTRWLAPAMGCFMLAVATLDPGTTQPFLIGSTNDLLPESNKARYSAYVAARMFHSEMNSVPVTRVEMNFGGGVAAKAQGVLQLTTNLMR